MVKTGILFIIFQREEVGAMLVVFNTRNIKLKTGYPGEWWFVIVTSVKCQVRTARNSITDILVKFEFDF